MARRPLGEPLFSLEARGACLLVILCWTWYRRRMLALGSLPTRHTLLDTVQEADARFGWKDDFGSPPGIENTGWERD